MELYQTEKHYIILDGQYSLWCKRNNEGTWEPKTGNDLLTAWNPVCIGLVYGLLGKIKIHPDSDWKLLLISKQTCVGQIKGNDVYKINKVAILSLLDSEQDDLELDRCAKHHFGIKNTDKITNTAENHGGTLQKTWNQIKSAAENIKQRKSSREKFEKRILEELLKMFNELDNFYYCKTYDLTNTMQRQFSQLCDSEDIMPTCDERFVWNYYMLSELTAIHTPLARHWVMPIIQGYVGIEKCYLDGSTSDAKHVPTSGQSDPRSFYTMVVISRRSRHRAGTRSKKRGLDETGSCANYVETEQIIEFSQHAVSFVQVRGSIPVYWSQTGVKYRPPPKLDKGIPETYQAFQKHIHSQLQLYKPITVVTLTELNGSERIIGEAYLENVLKYNSKDVIFVVFDFHEYCRGMKFENVSILTDWLKDIIKHMRYCWIDEKGKICEQQGIFRINCVDCLDRTNVVMTAIARIVLESQCRKLGFLAPEVRLPDNCRKIFQQLWANNGDAISKQYAGTVALKGDFTRTGERKMAGVMKDGLNSANRYYLRFKDTYRQAAIDLTHGISVSEDVLEGKIHEDDVKEMAEKEANTKQLIEDCKRMLILEPEECLGAWSLINADPARGETDNQDVDIVVLLSHKSVYVVWYDDEEEQIIQYQKIGLVDIEKIEIGAEPSLFKSKTVVMRIYYCHNGSNGFFHTFKASGTRMFNNVVIPVKTIEDARDQLNVICEAFKAAQNLIRRNLPVEDKGKLDKKKTQPHPDLKDISQQLQVGALSQIKLPRDVSNIDFSADKPGSLFISPSHTSNTLSPNLKSPSFSQLTMNPKDQKLSPSTNQKQLSSFGETSKAATFYIADNDANSIVVDHKIAIPTDHSVKAFMSDIRCLCTDKEKCHHKKKFQTQGSALWTGSNIWNSDLKITLSSEMNFKQHYRKSQETDMILPHVSKSVRMIQSHTSMRPSLSDTALAVSHSNLARDLSSISMRRSDMKINQELNEKLKMQIPNFLESSQMPRKCHRAFETLKMRMLQQLGERVCSSTVIFI